MNESNGRPPSFLYLLDHSSRGRSSAVLCTPLGCLVFELGPFRVEEDFSQRVHGGGSFRCCACMLSILGAEAWCKWAAAGDRQKGLCGWTCMIVHIPS